MRRCILRQCPKSIVHVIVLVTYSIVEIITISFNVRTCKYSYDHCKYSWEHRKFIVNIIRIIEDFIS